MRKTKEICSICGENEATSDDHLPPQSLYPKPRPANTKLHSVPACKDCNNGGSKEDEEFKALICIDTGAFQNEPEKIIDSVARTMNNNNKINQKIRDGKDVYTHLNGTILERAVAITFDREMYDRVISRIVRGLYWTKKNSALGKTTKITVADARSLNTANEQSIREILPLLQQNLLNGGTFIYKVHFNDDGSSFWAMQFFGQHAAFAFADAPKAVSRNA